MAVGKVTSQMLLRIYSVPTYKGIRNRVMNHAKFPSLGSTFKQERGANTRTNSQDNLIVIKVMCYRVTRGYYVGKKGESLSGEAFLGR